ncbi:hypothetical protein M4951_05705 [Blastopirellula sp. J2-11]|uniref:hypothetical protein n=1 Tax=Blastopirellula sp. J2-11 TaxID=2943192 RepID=UPI0021C78A1A|nr:hypothetical protein [Blastopirellula sp. J2-11]UUO07804.1 hypothetical protein M4951_05705 [Blastopirellula sp. J2-11]
MKHSIPARRRTRGQNEQWRFLSLLLVVVFSGSNGCREQEKSLPTVDSNTLEIGGDTKLFRQVIEQRITDKQYSAAVEIMNQAEVRSLVEHSDKSQDFRWMAVYEDALVFPGLDDMLAVNAPLSDYWILPGTSDAIVDPQWQATATKFAAQYNQLLQETRRSDVGNQSR